MIDLILNYRFMQYALIAGILSSIVCGIIGVIIIEKKLIMMSGGIAHTAYCGVGLGYLCNFEPILGALASAVISAICIGNVKNKKYYDVIIGLFWSLGMALGVIFVTLTPGYSPNIDSYLFGSILSITTTDLYLMIGLTIIVLLTIIVFFNYWKLFIFDENFAKIRGIKTKLLHYTLLILIALTIVILIRVVGIILIMALLCAPAAIAALISKKLQSRMIIASAFGIIFNFLGLYIAYLFDMPSGASIAIFAVVTFFIFYIGKSIYTKFNIKKLTKIKN
ncbi:MAG: metal ABC transporter permease [Clostridia bacterium]